MYSTVTTQEIPAPPACTSWCDNHGADTLDSHCATTDWVLTAAAHMDGDPGRFHVQLMQHADRPDAGPEWHRHEPVICLEAEHLYEDGGTGLAGAYLTLTEARHLIVKLSALVDQADIDGLFR